jgi:hypothetical protein
MAYPPKILREHYPMIRNWHEAGLTWREIADAYYQLTGIRATAAAFANHREAIGLMPRQVMGLPPGPKNQGYMLHVRTLIAHRLGMKVDPARLKSARRWAANTGFTLSA